MGYSTAPKVIVPQSQVQSAEGGVFVRKLYSRRQFVRRAGSAAGVAALGFGAPAVIRASESQWADLTGRFVYRASAPQREKLKVDKDVECCGQYDIRDESLLVAEDGGLANVYVYVRTRRVDICPELAEAAEDRVTLDNRDCIFMPHCLSIWYTEQDFYTVNSDPIAQNVAFSPLGDVPANIVLAAAPGENIDATYTFHRKQNVPVPIACNYHPWESAYILPREDPYVALSGEDGTFRLDKLPVGELEFQVWHERTGYLETAEWDRGRFEMEITPGTNDLGTIELDATLFEKA